MPISTHTSAPVELSLTFQWTKTEPILLRSDGGLDFPDVAKKPGIYRMRCTIPGRPPRVYIGESANLKSRVRAYASASAAVDGASPPNRGLHRRLVNALRHGVSAHYQLMREPVQMSIGGGAVELRLAHPFHRRLIENAALVYAKSRGRALVINAQGDKNVIVGPRDQAER